MRDRSEEIELIKEDMKNQRKEMIEQFAKDLYDKKSMRDDGNKMIEISDKFDRFVVQIADAFDLKAGSKEFDLDFLVTKAITAQKHSTLYNESLNMRKKIARALGIPIYSKKEEIISKIENLALHPLENSFPEYYSDVFKLKTTDTK